MKTGPALSEAQISGAFFVRHNAAAALVGLLLVAIGAGIARGQRSAYAGHGLFASARWGGDQVEVARYAARAAVGSESYTLTVSTHGRGEALRQASEVAGPDRRVQTVIDVARGDARRLLHASRSEHTLLGHVTKELGLPPGSLLLEQVPLVLRSAGPKAGQTLALRVGELDLLVEHAGAKEQRTPAGAATCDEYVLLHRGKNGKPDVIGVYLIGQGAERRVMALVTPELSARLVDYAWEPVEELR